MPYPVLSLLCACVMVPVGVAATPTMPVQSVPPDIRPDPNYDAAAPVPKDAHGDRRGLGIGFAATAAGAYIGAVDKEGAAAKAGIAVGMIVTHVNGIALRGMTTDQLAALIKRQPETVVLTIVGHAPVTLRRAPAPR